MALSAHRTYGLWTADRPAAPKLHVFCSLFLFILFSVFLFDTAGIALNFLRVKYFSRTPFLTFFTSETGFRELSTVLIQRYFAQRF